MNIGNRAANPFWTKTALGKEQVFLKKPIQSILATLQLLHLPSKSPSWVMRPKDQMDESHSLGLLYPRDLHLYSLL
jgi:hypothetical protein